MDIYKSGVVHGCREFVVSQGLAAQVFGLCHNAVEEIASGAISFPFQLFFED